MKIDKANISNEQGYIFLKHEGTRYFIARFKYAKNGIKGYINFLCKHFTVEQVIAKESDPQTAGRSFHDEMTALGYVSPNIKKAYAQLMTLDQDALHWGTGPQTNGQFAEYLRNTHPGLN